MNDELWAVRPARSGAEVWTENGRHVATFTCREVADEVVEDHNIGVEMERPEPPEVVRSAEERQAARLAEWRVYDPSAARLLTSLAEASQRLQRLLSLKAPNCIIVGSIDTICDRAATLRALYPPIDYDAEPSKALSTGGE